MVRSHWTFPRRLSCCVVLLPFLSLPLDAQPSPIEGRIERAIEGAAACFAPLPSIPSDQLWFLLRAHERRDYTGLGPVLERLRRRVRLDGLTALVDPAVPPIAMPLTGPRPWQTLMSLMRQSIDCRGGRAPSEELRAFVREQHVGYVLNHQILAIQWARAVGCRVPAEWVASERALADRVLAELETDSAFTDLFAERMGVVALAGKAASLESHWWESMLDAQHADGCWRASPRPIEIQFRGVTLRSTTDTVSVTHTSSLAVCALSHYPTGHRR